MILLSVLVSVVASVSTEKRPCRFVPDTRLDCVKYITFPDHGYGCYNSMNILEVTGLSKDINGEMWINVIDKDTKVIQLSNTGKPHYLEYR